jgi:glycerophosphoryl diester phosphodiesterase
MMRLSLFAMYLVAQLTLADVTYLPRSHAHNDYAHPRPLLDALDQGFASVEADIFLVGEELLVGHTAFELKKDRTLQKLYLDPLKERIGRHGGHVYSKDAPPLVLLIDFKSNGERTYARLRDVLEEYRDILSRLENGTWKPGAVTIVISGDRPKRAIEEDPKRLVGWDGRPTDLDSTVASDLMPMISESWGSLFRWKGEGSIPEEEKTKLHEFVRKAHEKGRLVRFWATPEKETVWNELHAAGVDLINTDKLADLRQYLITRP